jgi:hypothetical protein
MAARMLPGFGLMNASQAIGVLSVEHGGTGATTAAAARANLGITTPGPSEAIAGEALATGDVIRLARAGGATAGHAFLAENDSSVGQDFLGIILTGGILGDTIEYLVAGEVAVTFDSVPATTDNGKEVYLSSTLGRATLTVPNAAVVAVVRLGCLTGADGGSISPTVQLQYQLVSAL